MKPNFQKDIDNVFFKEMSERINFSGILLNAVITKNNFAGKLGGKKNYEHDEDILDREHKRVSIKTKDIPIAVEVGDEIEINHKEYTVKGISQNKGITTLSIIDYGA
ncbi:MAG: hypothetical protein KGV57_01095 [Fusobacterium sp.]|nr:hypothetical protein [Fusobacterium sp.]